MGVGTVGVLTGRCDTAAIRRVCSSTIGAVWSGVGPLNGDDAPATGAGVIARSCAGGGIGGGTIAREGAAGIEGLDAGFSGGRLDAGMNGCDGVRSSRGCVDPASANSGAGRPGVRGRGGIASVDGRAVDASIGRVVLAVACGGAGVNGRDGVESPSGRVDPESAKSGAGLGGPLSGRADLAPATRAGLFGRAEESGSSRAVNDAGAGSKGRDGVESACSIGPNRPVRGEGSARGDAGGANGGSGGAVFGKGGGCVQRGAVSDAGSGNGGNVHSALDCGGGGWLSAGFVGESGNKLARGIAGLVGESAVKIGGGAVSVLSPNVNGGGTVEKLGSVGGSYVIASVEGRATRPSPTG